VYAVFRAFHSEAIDQTDQGEQNLAAVVAVQRDLQERELALASACLAAAYELLDGRGFDVQLVNARDAKHVPGLLRASFRPKGEITALRAYLRQRERLLDYAASHIQHMRKALMQMRKKSLG
jgi:hypothetical protein